MADRMKAGQSDIYHIAGDKVAAALSSKTDLEVHYMADSIDEYGVQQLKEFAGKKLKSTTKEGLDIDDEDEKKKVGEMQADFEF